MKEIGLNRGHVAQVDENDFEWLLSSFGKWYEAQGYARCRFKGKTVLMHRVIWERQNGPIPKDRVIDHVDRFPLNNQKNNLRLATLAENTRNSRVQKNNRQLLKNVKYDPRHKRYQAAIRMGGKFIHGAMFDNAKDAGIACDILAQDYFGEFACLNFAEVSKEDRERVTAWMKNPKNRPGLSRFRGVTKDPKCDSLWISYSYEDVVKIVGRFYLEEDAAILADYFAIKNKGKEAILNFPNISEQEYERVFRMRRAIKRSNETSSIFRGVIYKKGQNKWEVSLSDGVRYSYGGRFDSERDAAIAYNLLADEHQSKSFRNVIDATEEEMNRVKSKLNQNRTKSYTSRYRGVMFVKQCQRWHARITIDKKNIHIGTFPSETEAALAYNKVASERLGDKAKLNLIS